MTYVTVSFPTGGNIFHVLVKKLSIDYDNVVYLQRSAALSLSLSLPPLPPSPSLGCDFHVCPENSHCNPINTIAECQCDNFYELNDEGNCVGE